MRESRCSWKVPTWDASMPKASQSALSPALLEPTLAVVKRRQMRFVEVWPVRSACTGWLDATSAVARFVPPTVVVVDGPADGARRRWRRDGS